MYYDNFNDYERYALYTNYERRIKQEEEEKEERIRRKRIFIENCRIFGAKIKRNEIHIRQNG